VNEITILIIDQQASFRAGVRQTLSQQPDFKVLDYGLSEDPMGPIDAHQPDIVLLGSDITAISGLELSGKIARYYPNTKVIILSPNPNDDELFEFIKTAVVAYLDKKTAAEELCSTIRRACRGEYLINESVMTRPTVAQHVLKQFQEIGSMGKAIESVVAPLTRLEKEILICVTICIIDRQIARSLRVSERTVKNHISSILRKLIACDRAYAVALSIQNDLVPVER
jgi:DNA-binding NarL/FixJ family response regulator